MCRASRSMRKRARQTRRRSLNLYPVSLLAFGLVCLLAGGCEKEMARQDRVQVMHEDDSQADLRADRPLPSDSVPRASRKEDYIKPTARVQLEAELAHDLDQGQRRFEIYCSLCHDRSGQGRGMITERGFPISAPLASPDSPHRKLDSVIQIIREGQGKMPDFRSRLTSGEIREIALYVEALQFSQRVPRRYLNNYDLQMLDREARKPGGP